MKKVSRIAIVFVVFIVIMSMLPACGKPSMLYRKAEPKDAMSLKEGEMLFKLRSTNIILLPRSAVKESDKGSLDAIVPSDVCKKEVKKNLQNSADKQNTDSQPNPDLNTEQEGTNVCIAKATVKTTAVSYGDYYIAIPGDNSPLSSTKLAAAPVDGDDSLLRYVTVSFNDKTKQVIANAGAGAVAGFGMGGPVGAAVGGIIGGGITLLDKSTLRTPQGKESFAKFICKSDGVTGTTVNLPDKIALTLPVVINLKDALQDNEGSEKGCWHLLPDNPFADKHKDKGSGWLYRVVLKEKPFGTQETAKYFEKFNNSWTPRNDFPFTPCQNAEFQLVWWSDAVNALKENSGNKDKIPYYNFPMNVANPDLVQVVPLPKAGSINFGTVCGAYVSYTTYSGPTSGDNVDAAITAVKNIKTAQDAYNKAHP